MEKGVTSNVFNQKAAFFVANGNKMKGGAGVEIKMVHCTNLVELFVLHVKVLVFLHVGLVLEGELAALPAAVEMGGVLALEGAVGRLAVVLPPEPVEPLPLDGVVFAVVVEVHLDVGGGDVDLVAGVGVDAVVVGLLLVVRARRELLGAVVHRGHTPKAVLEGLVHFLVPLGVTNHLLLLGKHFRVSRKVLQTQNNVGGFFSSLL